MPAQAEQAPAIADATRAQVRRPAILAVDDEPAVLAAVARDLRVGFGERYRILRVRLPAPRRSRSCASCARAASRWRC
jgi:hypothetical protein